MKVNGAVSVGHGSEMPTEDLAHVKTRRAGCKAPRHVHAVVGARISDHLARTPA